MLALDVRGVVLDGGRDAEVEFVRVVRQQPRRSGRGGGGGGGGREEGGCGRFAGGVV